MTTFTRFVDLQTTWPVTDWADEEMQRAALMLPITVRSEAEVIESTRSALPGMRWAVPTEGYDHLALDVIHQKGPGSAWAGREDHIVRIHADALAPGATISLDSDGCWVIRGTS